MLLKNKKGGEKYLSLWWFFILTIIGVGLVAGVAIFNSRTIDTRDLEADILAVKIADCLIDQGQIKQEVLESNFDIFSNCRIDESIISKSRKYFIAYDVYDAENCLNNVCPKITGKFWGVASFITDCQIAREISAAEYPRCSEKNIILTGKDGKRVLLKIIAGTNNKGGRIAGI